MFIKKIKNNKGDVESLMFVVGVLAVLVLIVFLLNVFELTWQRYIVKREVENLSRLYAIKWTELYKVPNCNGNLQTCSYNSISQSKLGQNIMDVLDLVVDEGNLNYSEIAIGRNPNAKCGESSTLLCIKSNKNGTTSITGASWDVAKQIEYGDTLYSSIYVEYEWNKTLKTERKESNYTINNKFKSERSGNSNDLIGFIFPINRLGGQNVFI